MSKFSGKRARNKPKNGGGKPFMRGDGPGIQIKLQEQWTVPGELWPTVYVGPVFKLNRAIKFLASQGLTPPQLELLKKGVAVGAKIGDQVRMFQIVSPQSDSGTYRYGQNGLEEIPKEELLAKAQAEAKQQAQKEQHGSTDDARAGQVASPEAAR